MDLFVIYYAGRIYYFITGDFCVMSCLHMVIDGSLLQVAGDTLGEFHSCHANIILVAARDWALELVDNISPSYFFLRRSWIVFH